MNELQLCLELRGKINDINDKIYELRASNYSPKNKIISDMPQAKGNGNSPQELYCIRIDELQREKKDLLQRQKKAWQGVNIKVNMSIQEKTLLFYRFVKGYSWKQCVVLMNEEYGGWDMNKAFRINGKINKLLENSDYIDKKSCL